MDGKYLMRFQSEKTVFKLLRRNVDGLLIPANNEPDPEVAGSSPALTTKLELFLGGP